MHILCSYQWDVRNDIFVASQTASRACVTTERRIEKNYGESIVPKTCSCGRHLTQAIFPLSRCSGVILFEPIP